MKSMQFTFLLLFTLSINCFGQHHPVTVTTELNSNGIYTFTANNSSTIPYYLIVFLKNAKNTKPSTSLPYQGTIHAYGTKQLFTVTSENKTKSCSFTYSYRYLHGSPDAKHNNKIAYLIPLKNVGATKISKVRNIAQVLNKEIAETWNCYSFIASPEDTVYASRRGTVLEVTDNYEVAGKNINFTINRNSVLMVHKDGTLARYSQFKKNGIFVKPGDEVYAGDPIGLVGEIARERVASLWLMIFQNNPKRYNLNSSINNISVSGINRITDKHNPENWIYINPNFITTNGIEKLIENKVYEPIHTDEGKNQELTKREKKKLLKK